MVKALLILLGAVLAIGSFFVYEYLSALGCAMNTTGCKSYTVNYFTSEAIFLFWSPLVMGLTLIISGLAIK